MPKKKEMIYFDCGVCARTCVATCRNMSIFMTRSIILGGFVVMILSLDNLP